MMFNLISLALILILSGVSAQRRRYDVCMEIADCVGCESNAPRIRVQRLAGNNVRGACDLMGPFPRGGMRCCNFGTRQRVDGIRLITDSTDSLGYVKIEVKQRGEAIPLFTHEVFERYPPNVDLLAHAFMWLIRGVVNEQTYRWGYGAYSPMAGRKTYEVEINVDECQYCESGAPNMQVWFVDRRGQVDAGGATCQIQDGMGFDRNARRRCRFQDNRRIGGIELGNANTDGIGMQSVIVRDVTGSPTKLFEWSRRSAMGFGGGRLETGMWVDGEIVPKQKLYWY